MTLEQPDFFVRGADGRDYPADHSSLTDWIRSGLVRPDQLVFVSAENRWVRVAQLPQFSAPSPPVSVVPIRRSNRPYIIAGGVGCLVICLVFVGVLVAGFLMDVQHRKAADKERVAIRHEREDRDRELIAKAPATAAALRAKLDRIGAAEKAKDSNAADAALADAKQIVAPYFSVKPLPDVLAAPLQSFREAEARAALRAELLRDYEAVRIKQGEAKRLKESKQWLGADKTLAEAEGLAKAILDRRERTAGLPATFAPEALYQSLKKERLTIAPRVQEQAALGAICGEAPFQSQWDGEYGKVESAVKRAAHDPSSIDVMNCTTAVLTREYCWVTTCEVRGKNALEAKVFEKRRFSMSTLGVEQIP